MLRGGRRGNANVAHLMVLGRRIAAKIEIPIPMITPFCRVFSKSMLATLLPNSEPGAETSNKRKKQPAIARPRTMQTDPEIEFVGAVLLVDVGAIEESGL